MANYHASQGYTMPMRKPGRYEGGVIAYPMVGSLGELAEQIAKVHRMKVHKDHAFHSTIQVFRGVRDPKWIGDYDMRDGKLIKIYS